MEKTKIHILTFSACVSLCLCAARGRFGPGSFRRGSSQNQRLWRQRPITQRRSRGERACDCYWTAYSSDCNRANLLLNLAKPIWISLNHISVQDSSLKKKKKLWTSSSNFTCKLSHQSNLTPKWKASFHLESVTCLTTTIISTGCGQLTCTCNRTQ